MLLIPTCFVAIWFGACDTTADDYQAELGLDYFPLAVGKTIVYEVDSTIFDPTGDTRVRHSKTFVKEETVDTLTDNLGQPLFKVERFERPNDTAAWKVAKVFTKSIQENQAIWTEDNLRFIKMTFPLRKNNTWNGNLHFDPTLIVTVAGETMEMFKGWAAKVKTLAEPAEIGAFQFLETVTVEEANNENLIELRTAKSVYAKGIGLVYRELWILDTQCIEDCAGLAWEEKAEKGFIVKQTVISHN